MKILDVTPEHLARIEAAAAADNHPALAPTHFAVDDRGEVRGCFSIAGATAVLFWSHTGNSSIQSLKLMNQSQQLAKATGKPVLYPCACDSPFAPLMAKMGFKRLGNADFWLLEKVIHA